jgi:4-amino-4-deoxy-L-arabinose transferase-like glycosyltransferase
MAHNGDYVHFYYNGKPDTWNAKPPLLIWSIVLAYKLFGYNAFALRFFSAVASVFFFFFAFKLVRLYANEKFAFIASLILLTCKAVIGFHVGRTGDADALLLLFVTASLYYFLLFIDFGK